ncbi:MAG: permease [Anaerolineaceae bacterium]|nr:permease [Anaerolineaceae bacterium]
MSIGQFIQNELLAMNWLQTLVGRILNRLGLQTGTGWGAALHFFIYDVIKIFILLSALIFLVSYIQGYFPPERTRRILANFRGIPAKVMAALLGTVTPFCSCSSIPLFIGFTSAQVPVGVSFSFLISSPMVDLGSIVLLMSIFNGRVALAYVLLGLLVAVIGGTVIERLNMEDQVEDFILQIKPLQEAEGAPLIQKARLAYALEQVQLTIHKVAPYVLVGVGIGAFIHNFIPQAWVETLLGQNHWYSVPLAVLVGVPMYADIFGTIPIAESLLAKGAGLGTVLSLMMAVTTLSLPSMVMLRRAIKPRLLGAFILIVTLGIMLVGYFFNVFQSLFM